MKKRRAKQQEVLRGIHPGTYKVLTASHRSKRSASRQHMLRDHGKQRSQTHNKLGGERVGLSAEVWGFHRGRGLRVHQGGILGHI